jgi:hypothetical protein
LNERLSSSPGVISGKEVGKYNPPSGARPLRRASLKVTSGDFKFVE